MKKHDGFQCGICDKEILNMKYPSEGIKPLFMVVYLKLDAHSISNS
jgi:hypothetical protein